MSSIDWLPWATPSFQRAQQARRPVLLLLDTSWSASSRRFATHTLASADVEAIIIAQFVAVRVDADWRPDIADRYGAGTWPTLLALTPEGHVLGGGHPPDAGLAAWLGLAAQRFRETDPGWPSAAVVPSPTTGQVDPADAVSEIWAQVAASVDPATGAFGSAGQPELSSALAALAGAASDLGPALTSAATETIDRLLASPRWDRSRGLLLCRGVSPTSVGDPVGRLDTQGDWVRLLVRAVECDPRPSWQEALQAGVDGLRTAFGPVATGWRPWTDGPAITVVDATARACRALLAVAQYRDDADIARDAIAAMEGMVPRAYSQGSGVAHVLTTRAHGPTLLTDAMTVAHALLDADPWRSQPVYRDLADELVRSAFSRLAHPSGALLDRRATMAGANAVGRLAVPVCPLEGNAEAARACMRLGPHEDEWQARALSVLLGVHADARHARGFAAPLALAWSCVLAPEHAISVW